MTDYFLETREFGLSEKGIHLLRSGFNYETIDYNDIRELTIKRDREVNNWLLLLIIGLMMLLFSAWYSWRLLSVLENGEVKVVSIQELVVPVLPCLFGLIFIYSSTRNGTIMSLTTNSGKRKRLSVSQLEKTNTLDELKHRLKEKLKNRAAF
jgi:hypothetical protein